MLNRLIFIPRIPILIVIVVVLTSLGEALWRTLLPIYLDLLGFEASYIGLIVGSTIMIPFLFSFPAGIISDRYGRITILILALGLMSLFLVVIALTSGMWLIIAVIALGVVTSLYNQSVIAMIAELTSISNRATMYGVYYALLNASMTMGSFLSGFIAENFGYRLLFLLSSLMALISFFTGIIIKDFKDEWKARRKLKMELTDLSYVLKGSSELQSLLVAIFLHDFFVFMAIPYVTLFAKKILGLREFEIGMLIGLRSLFTAFLHPISGRLADKIGGSLLLTVHVISTGILYVLYGVSRDFFDALILMLFFGVSFSLDMPARRALLSKIAPKDMLATINGIADTLVGIGALIAPLLGGLFWQMEQARSCFIVGGLLNMSAIIFLLALLRGRGRKSVTPA